MPLLRHYSSAYKFFGAVPGAQLIVRMISTVYNYDYIQDLVRHLTHCAWGFAPGWF